MGTQHEDALHRRREELRRIVYGTRDGAESDAARELAEVEAELAALAAAPSRPTGAAAAARPPVDSAAEASARAPVTSDSDTLVADADPDADPDAGIDIDAAPSVSTSEEPPPRWRPSRGQLIAAALVAFLLVATGIALIGPAREALSPARGLGVFERELLPDDQEVVDQVSTAARLGPDEAATLRSLGRAFGHEFWVFREDARVCMLSRRLYFFAWQQTCVTLQEFQTHGLTRRIPADDIRDGARPRRVGPGDVVVVTWGPESTELEWAIEP